MRHIRGALAHEAVMKLSQRRRQKGIKVQFPTGMGRERVEVEAGNVEVGNMIPRKKIQYIYKDYKTMASR